MPTHEIVKQAYAKAGVDLQPTANDKCYEKFMKLAKRGKAPITTQIQSLYRVMEKSSGKEYFWGHKILKARDRKGNLITAFYPHFGIYQEPVFERVYDEESDEVVTTDQVNELVTRYELEFTKENFAKIADGIDANTRFYVISSSGTKYGGLEREDWETLPFDRLVEVGRFGPDDSRTHKILKERDGQKRDVR